MTAASLTSGPTIASARSANGVCAGSIPGAMIKDQYRKPVKTTSTVTSSATVTAESVAEVPCGHATRAMRGNAEPHKCSMMCHLNHGSGVSRSISSAAHPIWPTNHSAAHAAMAPQNTA